MDNPRFKSVVAFLSILILGVVFQKGHFNEFPSHTHAWAQADRYALAQGFLNNDFNLLKPETFVYNHQFPDEWRDEGKTSITAVDFPIHDFVPAILMKIAGSKAPWTFRLYIFLYGVIGLFFLFKLTMLFTNDFLKSIFVVLFAAASPVFVYYQNGFLPTIPSLANALIGLYLYGQYLKGEKRKAFYLSILFLTLATLSRTTFAIPLIAVLCVEALRAIRGQSSIRIMIFPFAFSFLIIASYALYNGSLRAEYGAIFLGHIMPPRDFQHAVDIIKDASAQWKYQYFSKTQYMVFLFLIIGTLGRFLFSKMNISRTTETWSILIGTVFLGCCAFAVLMLQQFRNHDYYFLDTFYLPAILLLVLLMKLMPPTKDPKRKLLVVLVGVIFIVSMVMSALESQQSRTATGDWDQVGNTIVNFTGAEAFLDSVGVSDNAKILVLDAVAPNIPFLLMNRKGYAVMKPSAINIENALKWEADYIVFQNDYFLPKIYSKYPKIIEEARIVWDNGKISVCEKHSVDSGQTLDSFLALDKRLSTFEARFDSTSFVDSNWSNTYTLEADTSVFIGMIDGNKEFGLTFKSKDIPSLTQYDNTLFFNGWFKSFEAKDCELVIAIHEAGENVYYKSYNLREIIPHSGEWNHVPLVLSLPKVQSEDYELSVFLWNTGKGELFYKDFWFRLY